MRISGSLFCFAALAACTDPHIRELPDGGSEAGACAPALEACDPLVTCSETRDHKALCGACPAGYLGNGYDGCQPTLDGLTLSAGKLEPDFAKDVTEYLWVTGMAPEATTFTPSAAAGITISVDGKKVRTGEKTDSLGLLPYESRERTVQLVAPNGLTQTVKITTKRSWLWSQTVRASNRDPGDEFGRAVAVTDKYLVVGAPGEGSSDDPQVNDTTTSGAIYVYGLADGTEQAILKSRTPRIDDNFGASVAVVGDSIAVGVPNDSSGSKGVDGASGDDDAPQSGGAWTFVRKNDMWPHAHYFKGSNSSAGDMFGSSLAIDARWLVIGAPGEGSSSNDPEDESAYSAGAVYVFDTTVDPPKQLAYLKAPHPSEYSEFGTSVALSGDSIAVGARGESGGTRGINGTQTDLSAPGSGAVYIYRWSGSDFVFDSYLKASNAESGDGFGWSVALDDATLFVGAPYEAGASTTTPPDPTSNGAAGAGAVYVFRRENGAWREVAYLKAPRPRPDDSFGRRLASCSRQRALVGALGQDSSSTIAGNLADASSQSSGALFAIEPEPFGVRAALKRPLTQSGSELGSAVACSPTALVGGARSDRDDVSVGGGHGTAGAAFVYR